MTISEQLRESALFGKHLISSVGASEAFLYVIDFLISGEMLFDSMQGRTFMLLVAEALE